MATKTSESLVGQTAYAANGGRPVPIEVIKADEFRVQWRSLDLQFEGSMSVGRWNEMRRAQQKAIEEENAIRAKALKAAETLYDQMERIDGEAMHAGQVEQDPAADRFAWTRAVAGIIANEFGVND